MTLYMRDYRSSEAGKQKFSDMRAARRQFIDEIKSVPCEVCENTFPPYCMDFHHRDPETKKFGIGQQATVCGLERLLAEIDKCAILCAICHRKVEAGDVSLGG